MKGNKADELMNIDPGAYEMTLNQIQIRDL